MHHTDLPSCGTGQDVTFQISDAYWAIVRSLENGPDAAMFLIAIRVHDSRAWYVPIRRHVRLKIGEMHVVVAARHERFVERTENTPFGSAECVGLNGI